MIQDVPGVGKTLLARSIATSLHLQFQRIQFTADMMPSDITGVSIFDPKRQEFSFVHGPVFTHILLADEINRASPKTQSALLEAMNEGAITVDRNSHPLPRPFFVIATQNPIEFSGTYPLPESQLDRFMMCISVGYPPEDVERRVLLMEPMDQVLSGVTPLLDRDDVLRLQEEAGKVFVDEKLLTYIMTLVQHTRTHPDIMVGVSTRGAQNLLSASRARALLHGRGYCIPDDIKALVVPVFAHRILPRHFRDSLSETETTTRILQEILSKTEVPV
ncbi:MAG TPA: MoxR family ATPase [Thermoanaerobaculia bacterium]|nr:MoxR family ATPase [Thermoanaerobaculia bacterium]HUM29285.1 MoxR family ATPase [Thermoanaerobaculia bacterium]HXK67757.1 MoxR family ATPase [Thermoanaerobaculia bacterium]